MLGLGLDLKATIFGLEAHVLGLVARGLELATQGLGLSLHFVSFIIIIITIYLPRVCNSNNNNSEQTVGQDSKATQDALITAHKNYATQKKHNVLTNTSELNN